MSATDCLGAVLVLFYRGYDTASHRFYMFYTVTALIQPRHRYRFWPFRAGKTVRKTVETVETVLLPAHRYVPCIAAGTEA